jgi:inner membrane protein
LRALLISGIAVLILLPIKLIEGKISERRARAEQVVNRFAAETSGPQIVAGPFIALTCEEAYTDERQVMRAGKAETVSERKTRACATAYFPARTLRASASLPVETLHRGIYDIRLYRSTVDLSGELEWPARAPATGTVARAWKQAYLVVAVSDARGIKSIVSSRSPAIASGPGGSLAQFAIREDLGAYEAREPGERLAFGYKMELVGTSSLHIAPTGDATEIRMRSDWPHPSFSGGWSPDERRVSAQGFEAMWRTTHVATGGQPFWNKLAGEGKLATLTAAAGVSLFDPVNVYTLSYRATEYAFLFVLFTFAALALAEATTGIRLHAMQYLLTGSALAVFFLLLIALSEHIAFERAYACAAAACVALLTFYLRHPLGTWARTFGFSGIFVALYVSLYVLLRSEDHALLMGSLMVFALLAVAMIATRKLDWAEVSRQMKAA